MTIFYNHWGKSVSRRDFEVLPCQSATVKDEHDKKVHRGKVHQEYTILDGLVKKVNLWMGIPKRYTEGGSCKEGKLRVRHVKKVPWGKSMSGR